MKIARIALLLLLVPSLFGQAPAKKASAKKATAAKVAAPSKTETAALQRNIRAHLEFLASDALQGRQSASRDELIAGTYIAAQLRQFGVEPAGDNMNAADATSAKGYLQRVPLVQQQFDDVPVLIVGSSSFTHGREMAIIRARSAKFSGTLQKLKAGDKAQPGAIAYIHLGEGATDPPVRNQMMAPMQQGAAAVIIADTAQIRQRFAAAAKELPELPLSIGNVPSPLSAGGNIIVLNAEATAAVDAMADGASVAFAAKTKPGTENATTNVIGVLPGSDPKLSKEVILLTAHMDHLGITPNAKGDDKINNGADDDASGVVAVLELARKLAAGPRPKRTIYFVAFGSEERGGHGAQYFLQNPPVPLTDIAVNLEFEMIGRGDAAVPVDTLWLTGYERTNLGPELAKQGMKIVADPHPAEQFFMRSDNYALARKGVVAQTVSSYGLHKDYHQPSDDIAHIDFDHMTRSIQSTFAPVVWLSNSTFKPDWLPGKKP